MAQGGAWPFSGAVRGAPEAGLRRKLGLFTRARGRRWRWPSDLLERDGGEPGRFHADLPPAERCGRGSGQDGAVRRACSPTRPPTTHGPSAGASASTRSRRMPPRAGRAMRAVNPAYIPRNHRVEAVIEAAVERDDFAPFEELLAVLANPFEDQPGYAAYAQPPEPHSAWSRHSAEHKGDVQRTCGNIARNMRAACACACTRMCRACDGSDNTTPCAVGRFGSAGRNRDAATAGRGEGGRHEACGSAG